MRKKLISSGAALAALLLVSSVFSPQSTVAKPPLAPASVDADNELAVASPEKLDLIQNLRDAATSDPLRYAGVTTNGQDDIVINLAPGATTSTSVDKTMSELRALGSKVSTANREFGLNTLQSIANKFEAAVVDVKSLTTGLFAPIQSWGIDYDSNSFDIGVTSPLSESALSSLSGILGNAGITYHTEAEASDDSTRLTDTSPFYGGDRITDNSSSCTSSFVTTTSANQHVVITAAHCGNIGTQWSTNGNSLGTIRYNGYQNGSNLDAALIKDGSYSNHVWVGAVSSTTAQKATKAQNSCTGCLVSYDGSFSGQTPRARLVGDPRSIEIEGHIGRNCQYTEPTSGGFSEGPGDSGGPVLVGDGDGGVIAVGIIRGHRGSDTSFLYSGASSA